MVPGGDAMSRRSVAPRRQVGHPPIPAQRFGFRDFETARDFLDRLGPAYAMLHARTGEGYLIVTAEQAEVLQANGYELMG
jgi:hypothetical protein